MSRRDLHDDVARHRLHHRLTSAVAALPTPPGTATVVVDVDAFDANADELVARAHGKPVRLASKSLRVPALLSRALDRTGFAGILAYSLREALWLHGRGLSDDLVLGYPTVDRPALAALVADVDAARAITLMIDDPAQLDLAQQVASRPGSRQVGVMAYEGQVAGVPDDVPGARARSLAVRRVEAASVAQLSERRQVIAEALKQVADLEFWNAGGSGSLESSSADSVVSEVTAGSGLLVPHLFDHYRAFRPRPAAFFGLPVVRRPAPDTVTVAGGGLIGSGPAGPDRSPLPWTPPGLHLTRLEGAGEVQTPLVGPAAAALRLGDTVWFRHAKSGELAEHTREVHLLSGDRVLDTVPTYRGTGNSW